MSSAVQSFQKINKFRFLDCRNVAQSFEPNPHPHNTEVHANVKISFEFYM